MGIPLFVTYIPLTSLKVPQLIQNYRTGSAEAISIPFLTIWFIGDICSLIGTIPLQKKRKGILHTRKLLTPGFKALSGLA